MLPRVQQSHALEPARNRRVVRRRRGKLGALFDRPRGHCASLVQLRGKPGFEQFTALEFSRREAETRAEVYMGIISAEFLRAGGLEADERLKLARRQHHMLTGRD